MAEPRINVYVCGDCRKLTVTVDVDEGVTPFMIECQNGKGGCGGYAYSQFYPSGTKPAWIPDPQWEWFKPTGEGYAKLSEAMKEHVDKGGLDIRARTGKAPLLHDGERQRGEQPGEGRRKL